MSRPLKIPNLLKAVRDCVVEGRFIDTVHSRERQTERSVTRPEYLFVLKRGWHEKEKDRFDLRYQQWNYAVRGRSVDGQDLRVIVSFENTFQPGTLIIITVIVLEEC